MVATSAVGDSEQKGTAGYLLLEDGSRYDGRAFGSKKCSSGEVGMYTHGLILLK